MTLLGLVIIKGLISLYSSSKGLLQIVKSDSCFDFTYSRRQKELLTKTSRVFIILHRHSTRFYIITLQTPCVILHNQAPRTRRRLSTTTSQKPQSYICLACLKGLTNQLHIAATTSPKNLQSLIVTHASADGLTPKREEETK